MYVPALDRERGWPHSCLLLGGIMQSSKTGGECLGGVHYPWALRITGGDARSDPKADTPLGLENPNI